MTKMKERIMCQADYLVLVWIPIYYYGERRRCCSKSWYTHHLSIIYVEVPLEQSVEKQPLEVPDLVGFCFMMV